METLVRRLPTKIVLIVLLLSFLVNAESASARSFLFGEIGLSKQLSSQSKRLAVIISRPEIKRTRTTVVNRDAFQQQMISLNLFDDATFIGTFTERRKGDQAQFEAPEILSGVIDGKPLSHFEFYVYDTFVFGRIFTGSQLFMVNDMDNFNVVVTELDRSKIVPEGNDVYVTK